MEEWLYETGGEGEIDVRGQSFWVENSGGSEGWMLCCIHMVKRKSVNSSFIVENVIFPVMKTHT